MTVYLNDGTGGLSAAFRVEDKTKNPYAGAAGDLGQKKAGMLPYLTLVLGAAVVLWANWFFVLPG